MKDYSEILGIDRSASAEEIKAAHRTLIKKHHPDKNEGEHSQEFIDIQRAYEVLSDTEERALYDEYGFSSQDSELAKMSALVEQTVVKCMSQGTEPPRLINAIEAEFKADIDKLEGEREICEEAIDQYREQKDALKIKDGLKYDIVGNTILNLMRAAEAERLSKNQEIDIRTKILHLIEKYEKSGEMPDVRINFGQQHRQPPIWR